MRQIIYYVLLDIVWLSHEDPLNPENEGSERIILEIGKSSGWDITSSMELARKLHNISGSKEKVLNMVTDLDLSLTNVKKDRQKLDTYPRHYQMQFLCTFPNDVFQIMSNS